MTDDLLIFQFMLCCRTMTLLSVCIFSLYIAVVLLAFK